MPSLKITLLGSPQITSEGVLVDTGRRKAVALLAYLLLSQQIQRRETLAALFWPDYPSRDGRADLSRILSVLRKKLGPGWLLSQSQADRASRILKWRRPPGNSDALAVDLAMKKHAYARAGDREDLKAIEELRRQLSLLVE